MDTFLQLIQAVQSDLTVGTESSFLDVPTIKLAINRAYRKAGSLFRWPETEDAMMTNTVINQEYYDYPDNWQPDSAWKLTVDDVDYGDPLVFKDYLNQKENNVPSGLQYLWSSQWRRVFIYPTPTAVGSNNISIWGQKTVLALASDSDYTIFSYSMPEGNEAIVLEAVAILRAKGEDEKSGAFKSVESKQILATAWGKIRENQAKYEKTQSFLEVPDFFGKGGGGNTSNGSPIGNF